MIENDTTEKPVPRNEAKGIRIKLEKLETAFMVVFWNVILERLNKNENNDKDRISKLDVEEMITDESGNVGFLEHALLDTGATANFLRADIIEGVRRRAKAGSVLGDGKKSESGTDRGLYQGERKKVGCGGKKKKPK
ncbi:hypothetical protein JTB14_025906 [Gonioctena quinquepunctata]|nr:hypothetical protein JTB14_025906 [Gonioctena quinquepunctata]